MRDGRGRPESWDAWLRRVENVGFRKQYEKALNESFGGVEQIQKLFVRRTGETWVLEPKFFTEAGVKLQEHQQHFVERFCPRSPAAAPTAGEQLPSQAEVPEEEASRRRSQDRRTRTPLGHRVRFQDQSAEGAAEEPAAPLLGPQQAADPSSLVGESWSSWLRDVGVEEARYIHLLEGNFRSVEQVVQAYLHGPNGTADADLFCKDMGVAEPGDRERFEAWFKRGLHGAHSAGVQTPFREWLQQIDPTGGLLRYSQAFEEDYDSVHQVKAVYVTGIGGGRSLDPQFFEDLDVRDVGHQALFRKFFCGAGPVGPTTASAAAPQSVQSELPLPRPSVPTAASPLFPQRLAKVDPTGVLQQHAQCLEDVPVEDQSHRARFRAFSSWPSAQTAGAAASQGGEAMTSPARTSPLASWLAAMDPCLPQCYLKDIEKNYDDLQQIEDLYVTIEGGVRRLSARFFEDMGIKQEEHQALFKNYFTRGHAATTPAADSPGEAAYKAPPGQAAAAPWQASALQRTTPPWQAAVPPAAAACQWAASRPAAAVPRSAPAPADAAAPPARATPPWATAPRSAAQPRPAVEAPSTAVSKPAAPPHPPHTLDSAAAPSAPAAQSTASLESMKAAVSTATKKPQRTGEKDALISHFNAWLLAVDASGGLLQYIGAIEDNFDGVGQIEELYLRTKDGGGKYLDALFFKDVSIKDPNHRALFQKYYSIQVHGGPTRPEAPGAAAGEHAFSAWLKSIDPSGGLHVYLQDFVDNFDTPNQIEDLYVTDKGGRKVLDPDFFEDLGVKVPAHRRLFEAHFGCGGAAQITGEVDPVFKGRRLDSDTGKSFTFPEFLEYNRGEYTEKEIEAYWRDYMEPAMEERHQKWTNRWRDGGGPVSTSEP